jgi:hypothetical protein
MTVTAHYDGRVFVPDGPVDLPVGTSVRIIPAPDEGQSTPSAGGLAPPLAHLLAELQNLPDNPDWPTDGAAQHDHYLYGTPKRP